MPECRGSWLLTQIPQTRPPTHCTPTISCKLRSTCLPSTIYNASQTHRVALRFGLAVSTFLLRFQVFDSNPSRSPQRLTLHFPPRSVPLHLKSPLFHNGGHSYAFERVQARGSRAQARRNAPESGRVHVSIRRRHGAPLRLPQTTNANRRPPRC